MDFRGVSRHFADPDWDGPIDIDPDFGKKPVVPPKPIIDWPPLPPLPVQPKPIVDKNGCTVEIIQERVSIYDANGKLLRRESIIDYTKENIYGEFATLDNFILKWSAMKKKRELDGLLKEKGLDLEALKREQNMADVDDFDFICHVAFDRKPLTRAERAEKVKRSDFFSRYSGTAREVLEILLEKYKDLGVFEIENNAVLENDPLRKFGKPSRIMSFFGGVKGYNEALQELENIIYKAG